MKKMFLRAFSVFGILSLLLLALPASTVMGAIAIVPDTIDKDSTFTVTGFGYTSGNFVSIYLSSQEASVGQQMNINVTKYYAWERGVDVTGGIAFNNLSLPTTLSSGPIPGEPVHGGTYWIYTAYSPTILNINQNIVTKNQVFITGYGSIEIDLDDGPVGTEVEIAGDDFKAGEELTIEYDGDEIDIDSGDEEVQTNGTFELTIIIPESPAGDRIITVKDATGSEAEATFTVEPEIALSVTSGPSGTTVTVNGTGFGSNEDIEDVEFDSSNVAISNVDDGNSDGSLDFTFIVPYKGPGTYTVWVEDEDGNDAEADFTIAAEADITPQTTTTTPGHVGSEATITGSGFNPGTTVTVSYDGTAISGATTSVLTDGSFSINITIPVSASGSHTIAVSDGINTKTFNFFMEEDAPDAPTLITPQTALKAEQPVVFDWGDVTDDSMPVTYIWQLSIDSSFVTLAMAQKELTTPGFTMTEAEELPSASKDTPYYWRVKAVDSTGKESAWSAVNNLHTGFSLNIENWVWWVIGGVGFVLLVALGFLFGRRSITY